MTQSTITELQNTIKDLERTWGHLQVKYYYDGTQCGERCKHNRKMKKKTENERKKKS